MLMFTLKPYDVLFFGSGKPFNRGDIADSSFPPHPNTLASAIYSKLYYSGVISKKVIDNPDVINEVYGPFIQRDEIVYFPKPQTIYKRKKKKDIKEVFILKIYNEKLNLFDPDNTNKPPAISILPVYLEDKKDSESSNTVKDDKSKSEDKGDLEAFEALISSNGLKKYLKGDCVNKYNDIDPKCDILECNKLVYREQRIGISVDSSSRSVDSEDGLYRIEFLRFMEDVRLVFWVDFNLEGEGLRGSGLDDYKRLKEFFDSDPRSLKLGGEMRSVSYEVQEMNFHTWFKNEVGVEERINVSPGKVFECIFLSYGVFDEMLPNIEGFEIISACFGSYRFIGINQRKARQRKIKRALPPGSVIWLKSNIENTFSNPTFIFGEGGNYKLGFPRGKQEFIGTNLILLKEV